MKTTQKMFIILLLIFCIGSSASAATYFVHDVKTADGSPDLARSLKSLVVTAVSNNGGEVVGQSGSADYELHSDLIRLGQAYVLTVTKMKKGASEFSSRQKANAVEELDDAVERAVRAAILSVPAKKDLRVGEVRPSEEHQLQHRIASRSSTYFGFGPSGFVNMELNQLAYNLAIGHLWEVTPHSSIKVVGDSLWSGDMKTYLLMAQLGLNYSLTDGDSSPYIGGGFGFGGAGSAVTSVTTIGAFALQAGLGWQFFRTSTNQLDLFAGYSVILGDNTVGHPGFYGLRIGVLF
jgi:hypothetical protein